MQTIDTVPNEGVKGGVRNRKNQTEDGMSHPIKDRLATLHVSNESEKGEPQLQNKRGRTYHINRR